MFIHCFADNTPLDTVEVYNCRTDCWKTVAPMTTARAGCELVALNQRLLVVGGYDGNNTLSSMECFC